MHIDPIQNASEEKAPKPRQGLLTLAQTGAANGFRGAPDHHVGLQRAKLALAGLGALVTTTKLEAARG